MPPITRRSLLARAAAALGAFLLPAPRGARADDPPEGLVLHEWGVLVCDGGEFAGEGADVASAFPPFVYARRADRRSFLAEYERALDQPISIRKPVVHVYGAPGTRLVFRTRFAGGRPLVWWPRCDWDDTGLTWSVELEVEPSTSPRPVDPDHWFARLREPPALFCKTGDQVDRFLYYDGEVPYANRVRIEHAPGGAYRVSNGGPDPALDVYLTAPGRFVAHRDRLAPGESWDVEDGFAGEPADHLAGRLEAAGLTGPESRTIAGIWREEFFEGTSAALVYRLGDGVYDRLLPAEVEPRPSRFVRVGLVLVLDQDPDLARRVEGLIEDLASEAYEDRRAAEVELARIGRPALEALRRAQSTAADPHVRDRARALRLAIECRSGEPLGPEFEAFYEEWKANGRLNPYEVQNLRPR